MQTNRLILGTICYGLLNACAATHLQDRDSSTPVIPVDTVIDSIKCGLAKAVATDRAQRSGLLASTAKVKLNVNIVVGTSLTGGVSAGIPVATGATVTPSFTFTNDQTRTNNSEIDFNVDLRKTNVKICSYDNSIGYDAGFSGWIDQVVHGLGNAVAGDPKVSVVSYSYDSDFVVKNDASIGASVSIVPVTGNASLDSSRSDIQHLNVIIAAVHISYKNGKPLVGRNGRPFVDQDLR